MQTLILSQQEVHEVLTVELSIAAVERAFAASGRSEAVTPSFVDIVLEHHDGLFRAMPAYLGGSVGVKWVSSHPENPARNRLPAVMAVYVLSNPATGAPLAIMDATLLTAHRTGAAAAIATRCLAHAHDTLGLIGCGAQSPPTVEAHRALFPDIELQCADIARGAAERLASSFDGKAVSIAEAAGCDVVCTTTPSEQPLVRREWIKDTAHVNALGADAPGKQELDPQILRDARIFVDDVAQAAKVGELNVPIRRGELDVSRITATLGEVVAGRTRGRSKAQITVFDSTGLAVQDTALARAIYDEALNAGVGTPIRLLG